MYTLQAIVAATIAPTVAATIAPCTVYALLMMSYGQLLSVCLDEVMHVVALARVNRLLLVYPLSTLFDYFESRAHRKILYVR